MTQLNKHTVIYMTECKWCRKQYTGETICTLREHFKEHRQATKNPLHATATTQSFLVSSRDAPPNKRLLRIEPHSFLAFSKLEFSSHFLEGVRTMFAVRRLL